MIQEYCSRSTNPVTNVLLLIKNQESFESCFVAANRWYNKNEDIDYPHMIYSVMTDGHIAPIIDNTNKSMKYYKFLYYGTLREYQDNVKKIWAVIFGLR